MVPIIRHREEKQGVKAKWIQVMLNKEPVKSIWH